MGGCLKLGHVEQNGSINAAVPSQWSVSRSNGGMRETVELALSHMREGAKAGVTRRKYLRRDANIGQKEEREIDDGWGGRGEEERKKMKKKDTKKRSIWLDDR